MKSLSTIEKRSFLSLADLVQLEEAILATGYMSHEKALDEIERFAVDLGIDEYYFRSTPVEEMAKHLIAISASELVSRYGGTGVGIELINEEPDRALYIVELSKAKDIEDRVETRYPNYRIESYQTKNPSNHQKLRLYVVTKPQFPEISETELTFEHACSIAFLEGREPETLDRYRQAWEWMSNREAPYISLTEKPDTMETRVLVGIHGKGTRQFMANFTSQMRRHKLFSTRTFKEPFSDDKSIYTFYYPKLDADIIEDFTRDLNTIVMLPEHPITRLFSDGIYSSQAAVYAISAATFTNQFISALTEEYASLSNALKDQPEAKGILDKMKLRLVKDTFTESQIAKAVIDHHELVAQIYQDFVNRLHPSKRASKRNIQKHVKSIQSKIESDVPSPVDRAILQFFLTFNELILKTNFFRKDKICAVYRVDPRFLSKVDFPETPLGLFFFLGRPFIGFHIRFRDIARGGIRIVKSRNFSAYRENLDTAFMENYNLALTQQKKNKDIPEGGSKGVILLRRENQDEAERAFKDYIDGILDVIIAHEEVRDLYGTEEILFFGPDEGTAELMDWIPAYAQKRGYPFAKALSTGKSPTNGGIPHDVYGMTTTSVHQCVLGVLEKLGLDEKEISKIQTGGPDGDLGSNEIKMSKDKTIAIVDGSGVLFDPAGIHREELLRLATERKMVEHFDRSFLTPEGFFVSVNDKEITLPDGTFIPNGEQFRNTFHLNPLAKADLFVPCGGRPAAISINNWQQLLDERGVPKFKIIVEGANLFITEEARLRLEEHGIPLIKDATANKGGVTSSSLEVLAALALSDEQFDTHFRVTDGVVPPLMEQYISEIVATIKSNARKEFELLWRENQQKQVPFTELTNLVSRKINDITDAVFNSDLPANPLLRRKVVEEYTPNSLLNLIGLDDILARVPQNYLNAIVATEIAIGFVYSHGLDGNEIDFYNYLNHFLA